MRLLWYSVFDCINSLLSSLSTDLEVCHTLVVYWCVCVHLLSWARFNFQIDDTVQDATSFALIMPIYHTYG